MLVGTKAAHIIPICRRAKSGLREITRRAVRAQIADTAMALFVAHGFEQTTVDQIAAAVGISTRSVFRYFATKEDMVVGHLNEIGDKRADATVPIPALLRRRISSSGKLA
jgi:AcrR family transcriptional regulator